MRVSLLSSSSPFHAPRSARSPLVAAITCIAALCVPALLWAAPSSSGPSSGSPSESTAAIGPWSVITAPPAPDTAFARRLDFHRQEQRHVRERAHGAATPPQPGHFLAAEFASVPKPDWSLDHQDITVSVEPLTAELSGEVTATVSFHKDGIKNIAFRLGQLDTHAVTDGNGKKLTYKYSTGYNMGQLIVGLPKPSKKGTKWQVHVAYTRKLNCAQKTSPLRFCSFDNDIASVTFFRYYLSHGSAYPAPFTSKLHVITPKDRVATAPGTPSGPDQLGDQLVWHFDQPERTTSAGFSIAKYAVTGDADPQAKIDQGEPYMRMYTLQSFAPGAAALLKVARGIISYYGERFSPFPWRGLNIMQLANNFGGGYAPLAGVFMLRNVFGAKVNGQGYISYVELVAHELAHQWWGNLARPRGSGDVSLSESLAEFSSCYYTEKHLKSRSQIISDNLSYAYTVPANQDRPMQASNVYGSPKYVQIIYHKGAVVLDMLRRELGDKAMFAGLTAYAKQFNRDYARVADLRATMEKATGRELGWFFKQWWQRTGLIRAEFSGRVDPNDAGGWTVKLRVKQLTTTPYRFKLPYRITFADGTFEDKVADVVPKAGDGVTIVTTEVDKAVRGVRPDRSRVLLRRFEILTPGDVNLDGLVDGMDLMETAFRANRAIKFNNHFFPNMLWDELFDAKASYRIDDKDLDLIIEHAGAQSAKF